MIVRHVKQWWYARYLRFLDARAPTAIEHRLFRKNLYTFPSLTGFAFFGIVVLLWLLGTNYQNNLILALSYMLISLSIISILVTYGNLAGLKIRIVGDKPGFAGERIGFILEIDSRNSKGGDNIELRWEGAEPATFNVDPGVIKKITLYKRCDKRGFFLPGKLLVQSTFPLGVIRCWSWLKLDAKALVFPAPLAMDLPESLSKQSEGGGTQKSLDGEDFSGLREYYPGAPIKHVAWKHFAREKGLYSKEYGQDFVNDRWLDWSALESVGAEDRLSGLCYWALQLHQERVPYGLKLPRLTIAPDVGDEHHLSVLSALACFDVDGFAI